MNPWPARARRIALGIARNQAHRLGLHVPVNLLRRHPLRRGGTRFEQQPQARLLEHWAGLQALFARRLQEHGLGGGVGLEIGAGDNIGPAFALLCAGAARIHLVERLPTVRLDTLAVARLQAFARTLRGGERTLGEALEAHAGGWRLRPHRLRLHVASFETVQPGEPLDFIYSNDTLEHVRDVKSVFAHAFRLLKPGGVFVNNVDFRGHNGHGPATDPLDFLIYGGPLWRLMTSHLETTNRVRPSELLGAARNAGFEHLETRVLDRHTPDAVQRSVHELPARLRALGEEDLSIAQAVLCWRRPI